MVPSDKILKTARDSNADLIGLSGPHHPFARRDGARRERDGARGFTVPLLIGGATTSRTHTAVKIAPAYPHVVVHVQDASRAVGVMGSLVSLDLREGYADENARNKSVPGETPVRKAQPLLSLADARGKKPAYDWFCLYATAPIISGHPRVQSCASGRNRSLH